MSTAETRSPLDPLALSRLKGLELPARRIVEGYVTGLHSSPFRGFSTEFAEHREYTPGDDLRRVDWKVYGKTDKVYLKQFEEETNLICYLLLDVSESMQYRGPDAPMSKLEYARTAVASLAYLVLQQHDSLSLATFDDEVRSLVRASSKASQFKQVLHVLDHVEPHHKTQAGPILHDLAERLKRRGLVVVVSDLLDDTHSLLAGLKHLRHRRHDVIVMHIVDPAELEFPFERITLFRGLEQLSNVVTDPRAMRESYLKEYGRFLKTIQAGCRSQQADYVQLRTDTPLDMALSSYLAARMNRRA